MKTVRFGIIGCGLMGREFASAAARWCHLPDMTVRPEIVSVCDANPAILEWYTGNFASVKQSTASYRELLANPAVDAVYVAVPHNLHREIYCAAIEAGKALMGEKPFGIDRPACDAILESIRRNPSVFVRCCSEYPFHPAMQRIGSMIESRAFGRVIEVTGQFLHSSDLDPTKPLNWKRQVKFNGEYGVMGDLGMHVCHVPFRAGWAPRNVRAVLSKIVAQRPDGKGGSAPCDTWDNATLLCEAEDPADGATFPMLLKTQRIAPGEKNTWTFEVKGTAGCARFTTKNPKRLEVMRYTGGEQIWEQIDTGHETAFKSITGGIFEFGFSDGIVQMWAAFLNEMAGGRAGRFTTCVTPQEAALSHRLFTAALASHRNASTEQV